jgi:thiol:disulfide interchange protein DsbD
MERLKQLLAFPMYATAAWLVWVLSVQVGPDGVAAVLAGMVLLALGLWLLDYARIGSGAWRKAALGGGIGGMVLALLLGIGLERAALAPSAQAVADASASAPERRPYSAALLAEARAAGRPVFVNMTAAWCITCLVNERVALDRTAVIGAFAARDVLYLKGDWTNRDPAITAYLEGFGRTGVPIYVYYPPGGAPAVLPQVLTEAIVLDALASTPDPAPDASPDTVQAG